MRLDDFFLYQFIFVYFLYIPVIRKSTTQKKDSNESKSKLCSLSLVYPLGKNDLGPVQTPLHSCAEPNWGIKYGKRAASESVWYGSFNLVRQKR